MAERPADATALLEVEGLRVAFGRPPDEQVAVDGVGFALGARETLGIVGESGSGKSMTALAVLGLVPNPPGRIAAGSVRFDGVELVGAGRAALEAIRGDRIGMIFQEPMSALNPVFTVGEQVAETLRVHQDLSRRAARTRAVEMLDRVGIADAGRRAGQYPHELSGGMRQRVMIAAALACRPRLLIADEPTTALDVTIQAQILALLKELQREFGMAVILITHDLGVVAQMVDRVLVMYAGRVVEEGEVERVFAAPSHPYTRLLLESIPSLDHERDRLPAIPGMVPSLSELPPGCRFHPRCPLAMDRCRVASPALDPVPGEPAGHRAACFALERVPA